MNPVRPIAEESRLLMAVCTVPVIGIIPRFITLITLDSKMKNAVIERDADLTFRLMRLSNQYFAADLVRDMLTVVFIIAGLTSGTLIYGLALSRAIDWVAGFSFGIHLINIDKHDQVLKRIQQAGIAFV